MSNSILRRLASVFTSFITGSPPYAPVPTTRRWHFQGIFSYGHTPLSMEEQIPWKCQRLVVGTGAYGGLPVMEEVQREAKRRKIELLILPTTQAIETLKQEPDETNAILHVTC